MKKNSMQQLLTAVLFSLIMLPSCQQDENHVKPNILFLFADDWGKYASIYDEIEGGNTINSVFETPNIDGVGEDGIVFTNAHVPVPSCTPCRSSILSGQYFYKTGMGAILHGAEWDFSIPSYPLMLSENGYHIGYTYKVWSPGTPRDAPYGGDSTKYEQAGNNFNNFSQYVSSHENHEKAIDELLEEARMNFKYFLQDKKEDQPFCYWFGPTNTHRSWTQGSGKDIWGLDPDALKGKLPGFLPDVPEIREDFNDYLGESKAWDAGVGVILDVLAESGYEENTIIVVSGDHGIPGFPRAKTNLYYFGTEVPLLIKWPKEFKGNRIVDDFVNLMDLAPTFLELAGVEVPEVMDGKSLIPILKSNKEGWVNKENNYVLTGRERHVSTAREGNLPYPQRAIRKENYVYIRNFKPERQPIGTLETGMRDIDNGPTKTWFYLNMNNPEYQTEWDLAFELRPYEELYDTREDPYEMNNVAYDPDYEKVKNELAEMLDSLMKMTEDPRLNNENCIFDQMPYTRVSERELNRQKEFNEQFQQLLKKVE